MIRHIAPQFFTLDIPGTLAYYEAKLGFKFLGTWQDPPACAIVARDQQAIHFRCAEPPTANPIKYFSYDAVSIICCTHNSKVASRILRQGQDDLPPDGRQSGKT